MTNRKDKKCELDETKMCDNCGECEKCDLYPGKTCDNCGDCLKEMELPVDEKGYYNFDAKMDMSGDTKFEQIWKAYGFNEDNEHNDDECDCNEHHCDCEKHNHQHDNCEDKKHNNTNDCHCHNHDKNCNC